MTKKIHINRCVDWSGVAKKLREAGQLASDLQDHWKTEGKKLFKSGARKNQAKAERLDLAATWAAEAHHSAVELSCLVRELRPRGS